MTPASDSCSHSAVTVHRQPAWSSRDLAGNPHQVSDKAARVQRMFGAIAWRYDLNNRVHSFGMDQVWRRRLVRLCEIRPSDEVLDVACGTGDLSFAFADAHARRIVGLDFSAEMLQVAERKSAAVQKHRLESCVLPQFLKGDAHALPFEDEAFDVVSIAFGIRNCAEPIRALGEFARVLRRDGKLAILEFTQPRNRLLRFLNRIYTNSIMPMTAAIIAQDRAGAYKYLPRSIETFADEHSLAHMIRQAGFDAPTIHPMTFGVCSAYIATRRCG